MEGEETTEEARETENKPPQINRKWLYISIGSAVLVLVLGISAFFVVRSYFQNSSDNAVSNNNGQSSESVAISEETGIRRMIDGVYVKEGEENLFPVAVMLDNHPDAYPQAGLSRANLVFEAEVEGGISRYMAVFANQKNVEVIGPVRSARPYFLDWVQEFSACYTHCGGSPEALVRISKENVIDMNEFYQGEYFWRDTVRTAPHNVMTSLENIRAYTAENQEGKYFSWKFKDAPTLDAEAEYDSEISVNNFGVKWIFDPVANEYTRYLHKNVHKDASGEDIKAKNIAVAYIEAEVIDDLLRLRMDTTGTGTALICFDGNCREGEWHKKSPSTRMRFYNINEEEFIFNAGTTWIEVVRPEYEVEY